MPSPELALLEARLAQASSVEEIARAIIGVGRRMIGCDGITFVINENGFCHYLDEDAISPLWKGNKYPAAHCISGWVMSNRRATMIPNIFQDERIPHDVYRRTFVKSLEMVPVGDRGAAAIGSYWAEFHDPTEHESTTLHILARAAAAALERLESVT
ncbi:GAF domain-containing protein [Magnetospirillum aberrantis]|uniref:GAF domain-containing protein n=1 Tax=Magnetospirillum aberrantis SpK TaxID=908842 RepID=A0A7C9QTF9_9PROT|nr:GAF domain-containing protein [Magnetospirillum aberrantis]NFV79681.1 GAF domain-containing protein [Magnetospirillum aberrantis SpK]